ncbi:hypothetical protein TNIN_245151 [Trichonephila inaurata madagascariensis]|uniref:Uncharacterized protein n=1 Tax=Trichonephila inaurata madagascariensis TaxID=2747483 RepID=A0A8X7CAA3_9ARAC|nr:hypothetical protein TNIN_245151 [Trichonephila inaurata madagascariensis]
MTNKKMHMIYHHKVYPDDPQSSNEGGKQSKKIIKITQFCFSSSDQRLIEKGQQQGQVWILGSDAVTKDVVDADHL